MGEKNTFAIPWGQARVTYWLSPSIQAAQVTHGILAGKGEKG